MDREQGIQHIAYQLWEEEGCPQGRSLEHYFKAEAIVLFQERHGLLGSSSSFSSSSGVQTQTRSRGTHQQGS